MEKQITLSDRQRDSGMIESYNVIQSIPKSIKLELVSSCNFNCKMCFPGMKKQTHFLSDNDFKIAYDNIQNSKCKQVGVLFLGESTLHPNLVKFIFTLKQFVNYVFLTTNGLLVDDNLANGLIKSGLNSLKWSINYYSPESFAYQTRRSKNDFYVILKNIKNMFFTRKAYNVNLKLYASTVVDNPKYISPEHEYFLQHHIAPYVDEIVIDKKTNHGGFDNNNICSNITDGIIPCPRLFNNIYIRANLDVVLCCNGFTDEFKLGNLRNKPMIDIWNCKKMIKLRQQHISGNLQNTICTKIKI